VIEKRQYLVKKQSKRDQHWSLRGGKMYALRERALLGAIECHELLGEHNMARKLMKEYRDEKNNPQKKENEMIKKNQVFEGTLVAAGWDRLDHVNQSSLYTQDDEDILLDHGLGMKKFIPFLNQKVRIWGDVTSNRRMERRISVKKIIRILDGFTKPLGEKFDELGNLLAPAA
jgi:hypothetical protein